MLQTPETSHAVASRIVGSVRLDPKFDRLSVIDLATKTVLLWGLSDDAASDKFPLLIRRFIP